MKKNKLIIIVLLAILCVVATIAGSYALFVYNVTKNTDFKLMIGNLELLVTDTNTEDKYILDKVVPTRDEVALEQDGYNFTITNNGTIDTYYTVYLDDILLDNNLDRLDNKYIKFNLYNDSTKVSRTDTLSNYDDNRILTSGVLKKSESISYTLRMWLDYKTGNEAQNKYFATQIRVVGTQANAMTYKEEILNGAYPVISDGLVPVTIAEDGTVSKASLSSKWYSYADKIWANAVILKDESINYKDDDIIPEDNIESYFVWIPRYKYKIFNTGSYTGLTSIGDSTQTIEVVFENKDINVSNGTTVGSYLTHPAFTSLDVNGIWVGKFETGYDGASTTAEAQVNSVDTSKIIIKPNVYSWRNITVENMFKNSYDYNRNLDSHMMKNTEWGAVAYLQHSAYGSGASVRINNNSAYITGYAATEEPTLGPSGTSTAGNRIESTALGVDATYSVNYLNSKSVVASTTSNYSGIYDMSGGACEYVMGYTTGATTVGGNSSITSLYLNFFSDSTYSKYWDKYTSTVSTNYNNRILGDATGEMGPFGTEKYSNGVSTNESSWYKDYAYFANSSNPWFVRGCGWLNGTAAGAFAFVDFTGGTSTYNSFRVVLAPTK